MTAARFPDYGSYAYRGDEGIPCYLADEDHLRGHLAMAVSSAASAERVGALGVPVERDVVGVARRPRALGPFDPVADFQLHDPTDPRCPSTGVAVRP